MSLYQEVHHMGHEQESNYKSRLGEDNRSTERHIYRSDREWLHYKGSMCTGTLHYADVL